jgi:hypothetical protein
MSDFIELLQQHGLEHLTQNILLTLVSAEDDECALPEAKLVSGLWRTAVDSLVLKTPVGKIASLNRIKIVMRR